MLLAPLSILTNLLCGLVACVKELALFILNDGHFILLVIHMIICDCICYSSFVSCFNAHVSLWSMLQKGTYFVLTRGEINHMLLCGTCSKREKYSTCSSLDALRMGTCFV